MTSVSIRCGAVAALALAAGGVALQAPAQEWRLDPLYETVRLSAGFTPDPYWVNVRSGGSIDAQDSIGSNAPGNAGDRRCRGNIANAPDVRLHYTAGQTLPLILSVASDADTTLVVNGPDGTWYCDDDSGEGLNPSLRFDSPSSGQYDIWIGTYGGSTLYEARLSISELRSQ